MGRGGLNRRSRYNVSAKKKKLKVLKCCVFFGEGGRCSQIFSFLWREGLGA